MENPQIRIERTATLEPPLSLSSSCVSESEDLPPFWRTQKRSLSSQVSMYEVPRNRAWERRRRQFLHQEQRKNDYDLTDEDLKELKGIRVWIQRRRWTEIVHYYSCARSLFAVNRQFLTSPVSQTQQRWRRHTNRPRGRHPLNHPSIEPGLLLF